MDNARKRNRSYCFHFFKICGNCAGRRIYDRFCRALNSETDGDNALSNFTLHLNIASFLQLSEICKNKTFLYLQVSLNTQTYFVSSPNFKEVIQFFHWCCPDWLTNSLVDWSQKPVFLGSSIMEQNQPCFHLLMALYVWRIICKDREKGPKVKTCLLGVLLKGWGSGGCILYITM